MHKAISIFVMTVILLTASTSRAVAFEVDIHADITREALRFLKPYILEIIVASNVNVDSSHGGWNHDTRTSHAWHFDNCLFEQAAADINLQHAVAAMAFSHPYFAYFAAGYFGKLLHPVQDFYSHSNWVELGKHELIDDGLSAWNAMQPFTVVKGVFIVQGEDYEEPYIPPGFRLTLVSRTNEVYVNGNPGLISGSSGHSSDDCPDDVTVNHGGSGHGGLNKDSLGRVGYQQARWLATDQTVHEWCRLVSEVRRNWGEQGVNLLFETWVDDQARARQACGL